MAEAEKALVDEQADHSYEVQTEALDKEKEDFNKLQDEKIKDIRNNLDTQERILDEHLKIVQSKYTNTMKDIEKVGEMFSYTMTDYYSSPIDTAISKAETLKSMLESINYDKALNVPNKGLDTSQLDSTTKDAIEKDKKEEEKKETATDKDGDKPKKEKEEKPKYYPQYKGKSVSIVDALKSLGYYTESSPENRAKIAKANGIVKKLADYTGTSKQNTDMLNLLKAGTLKKYASGVTNLGQDELAITQEDGTEFIIRPHEGILTPLKQGDSVLTARQTENLIAMSKMNIGAFNPINTMPNIPLRNNNVVIENIDNSLHLSGITRDEINRETQKMIDNIPNTLMTELRKHGVGVNGSRRR